MEEIKFRAWNTKTKEWWYFGLNDLVHNKELKQDWFRLENISQYIGRKDKDGKEIYSGYILQAEEDGQKLEPVVVVWHGDGWHIESIKSKFIMRATDWSNYKMIGNIFQNPELLK